MCESSVAVTLGFEDSSLGNVVGYTLWHRRAEDLSYQAEPTCTLFAPNTRFVLSDLTSDTDYVLKVVSLDSNRELGMREIHFRTASCGIQQDMNPDSKMMMEVERSESPTTICSSLSNPSSVEDETNHHLIIPCSNSPTPKISSANGYNETTSSLLDEEHHSMGKTVSRSDTTELTGTNVESKDAAETQVTDDRSTENGKECVPYSSEEAVLPITPLKVDKKKGKAKAKGKAVVQNSRPRPELVVGGELDNGSGKDDDPQGGGSSSKKRSAEEESMVVDKDFEYYVKVIRWLECDGHIETGFRQKFLTWYSLRATAQEVRIVKVFVDTFIEDPESLAGQLMDTFSDIISNKRTTLIPHGFCLKLWH